MTRLPNMAIVRAYLTVLLALFASQTEAQDLVLPFEGTLTPDLKDLVDVTCRPAKNTIPCSEKGGLDLNPRGCANITAVANIGPSRSYFYDQSLKKCVDYVFRGCEPGGNHFSSLAECQAACTPVCQQSAPVSSSSSGEICEGNSLVWYYNVGESRCVQALWDGCQVTNNVFESESECSRTCSELEVDSGVVNISPISENELAQEAAKFCNSFEPTTSLLTPTRQSSPTDSTSRQPAVNSEESPAERARSTSPPLIPEVAPTTTESGINRTVESVCEQLMCVRHSTPIKSRLSFVSVFARTDCIEVVVRLRCRKGLTHRPSDAELDRLCELVRDGIQQYWSRSAGITVSCPNEQEVNVSVRVQLVSHWLGINAKDVVVKVYDTDPLIGNKRSHNSDILPMTVKYDETTAVRNRPRYDDLFKEKCAHELGHSVLRAARGFRYSWTHKGTSTWYGKLLNSNPPPASGEIDLMKYFASPYPSDRLSRTIAAEKDVISLVAVAARSYCSGAACGKALQFPHGHPCFENKECQSGRCQFFRCVECTSHTHCETGYYCANQLAVWKPNRCYSAKSHGSFCLSDRECRSSRCHAGRCGECETDSHCPPSQYCHGRNMGPLQANTCGPQKANGKACTRDRECKSNRCHGFRCGECENDIHCPENQYCSGRLLGPLQTNTCEQKKPNGAACSRDRQCSSNSCHGLRCGECENDDDCPTGEFCSGRIVGVFQANRCEKAKEDGKVCLNDRQCQSGKCHFGRCSKCESDLHCPESHYCAGLNNPFKTNRCERRLATRSRCIRNRQCITGRCHFLSCVECSQDSHCTQQSRYCSKRPLGNGLCTDRKCNGFCSRDRQCKSYNCRWYARCAEC